MLNESFEKALYQTQLDVLNQGSYNCVVWFEIILLTNILP